MLGAPEKKTRRRSLRGIEEISRSLYPQEEAITGGRFGDKDRAQSRTRQSASREQTPDHGAEKSKCSGSKEKENHQ